jgi:phosphate transport system permease protein
MKERQEGRGDLLGQSLTSLCAGALGFSILLTLGLLVLLAYQGMGFFWQKGLVLLVLRDGSRVLGEVHADEEIPGHDPSATPKTRTQLKVGNRDLTGADFRWVDEAEIAERSYPADAAILERLEWGNFYGTLLEMRRGETVLATGTDATWKAFDALHPKKTEELARVIALEKKEIGAVNQRIERLRLERRKVELSSAAPEERGRKLGENDAELAREQALYDALAGELRSRRDALLAETVVVEAADGTRKDVPVGSIVRAVRPNAMGTIGKTGLYLSRVREFLMDDPRESNTEGGIFPAIFGTVMMVLLMSLAVAPLGVLAALYLREYAKQGPVVRAVRIAVNNLAGVPSIVFGVFGLGFFVYFVGGSIDRLFYADRLPSPTFGTGGILWASLTLALLTVPVVIVAAEEGLAAVPRVVREGSLALGATKFETTWRVVLPAAAPGILTGMILAMARAAGEVAPLMIVGMVKLAPALPVDGHFPFVHLERKFMHLGFHIYDVGFQSPNVEATKPLVFATALLLILVVTAINLLAISLRNRLRRKYATSVV